MTIQLIITYQLKEILHTMRRIPLMTRVVLLQINLMMSKDIMIKHMKKATMMNMEIGYIMKDMVIKDMKKVIMMKMVIGYIMKDMDRKKKKLVHSSIRKHHWIKL